MDWANVFAGQGPFTVACQLRALHASNDALQHQVETLSAELARALAALAVAPVVNGSATVATHLMGGDSAVPLALFEDATQQLRQEQALLRRDLDGGLMRAVGPPALRACTILTGQIR